MAHGGKRPNAGRKPSALTVKTREEAEKAIENGVTPLAYFLRVLEGTETLDPAKFEAAKAAAPYIHPRLAAVENKLSGSLDIAGIDRPPNETREQWIERRKRELRAAAALGTAAGTADRSH
jgi:hypothetical protein